MRFLIVNDRKKNTLHELIKSCSELGSVIQTDESSAYKGCDNEGYVHETVSHSQWLINLRDGTHTHSRNRAHVGRG